MSPLARMKRNPRRSQRGVVLFVALIAMVILSLGGVALVRSMDAGTSVAGNLAFRQASIVAANRAVEDAVWKLYKAPPLTRIDPTVDNPAMNYYSTLQAGEKPDGTPALMSGSYPPAGYAMPVWTDPSTLVEVRHVIERVCNTTGLPTIGACDLLPPKKSPGGTDNEYKGIPIPAIPHYRVTVRVDLPNTNSTTIAQTFLR